MSKSKKIKSFDPNGVRLANGKFIGLPFEEEDAEVVLITVPWDVTSSHKGGACTGPINILESSYRVNLFIPDLPTAWQMGIFFRPPDPHWLQRSQELRPMAEEYIQALENESGTDSDDIWQTLSQNIISHVNQAAGELRAWVKGESQSLIARGKLLGVIGGDHSVSLGLLDALAEKYDSFGVLHIDAHMDLRESYQDFEYSHASTFFHAIQIPQISRVVQLGIRDCCEEEINRTEAQKDKIKVFWDQDLQDHLQEGVSWSEQVDEILKELPEKVYLSLDIDGLEARFCPNTGTPVPGGLSYAQFCYLVRKLVQSGRILIGFDLVEVAGIGNDWDGNVGARLTYFLSCWMGKSQGRL
ncbi:MAG: agmatinase family protein [Bacteroidota bacterium]